MSESWLKTAIKLGVPSLIAIWLVFQVGGDLRVTVRQTALAVSTLSVTLQEHIESTNEISRSLQTLVNLQLQQCVNLADDYVKRDRCFQALTGAPERHPN